MDQSWQLSMGMKMKQFNDPDASIGNRRHESDLNDKAQDNLENPLRHTRAVVTSECQLLLTPGDPNYPAPNCGTQITAAYTPLPRQHKHSGVCGV